MKTFFLCFRSEHQTKNFERYLKEDIFPKIVEECYWGLDETQWPIREEDYEALAETVDCHPNLNTHDWQLIVQYF